MQIKDNYIVKKTNILNELRPNLMTLQELRFFTIYLSKINPSDRDTKVVRFSLTDFQSIMNLGRLNIKYIDGVTDSLLKKIIKIPNKDGTRGFEKFQLFSKCKIVFDEVENYNYLEIEAHDEALPLLFEYKNKFFTYKLWNALRLKSVNQLRMYEILKQYEKIGTRILTIDELKELIGIDKNEYVRYGDFKVRVLEACQVALAENTDIIFDFEPYGKKGKGGKIVALKFTIKNNKNYVDELSLADFVDIQNTVEEEQKLLEKVNKSSYDERIEFLSEACKNEFSIKEMIVIYNEICDKHEELILDELRCYDFLHSKYAELNMRAEKTTIKNRFAYLKTII